MKILLEQNECISVRECEDDNMRSHDGLGYVSASLIRKDIYKNKKGCYCEKLQPSQDVQFESVLFHLVDISTRIDMRIKLRDLAMDVNKFCCNTGNWILVSVACDKKELRFDIYNYDKEELLKQELTLDELADFINEFNKRNDVTV